MVMLALPILLAALFGYAQAATTWNITVGNSTANATTVFTPAQLTAIAGDTLVFNFTLGNHSATQSTFAEPCLLASVGNTGINAWDSGVRDAGNGTAISQYIVQVTTNSTIWFFDYNTCGLGGVGAVNPNNTQASQQPFNAFVRNAERLNGTATSTTTSATATGTSPSSSSSSSPSPTSTSGAERMAVFGGLAVLPLIVAAISL